jgi:site-specific DNA-methyltransferase (adenine-specific)
MEPIVVRLSDSVTLINADCRDVLPVECDAVVTDPPYFRVKGEAWDRQWDNASAFLDFIGERVQAWHRDLRPNGSLYCFASPKMAARVECKIGERFNVLNSIVWDKGRMSRMAGKEDERLRQYVQMSERIIFAEHYGADNMAKGEAGYQAKCDELRGFVFEPLRAYLDGERRRANVDKADCNVACGFSHSAGGMASRHYFSASQWCLPTAEHYAALRDLFNRNGGEYLRREYEYLRREYEDLRREYEELRREYEELRREYEALRRPFFLKQDEQHTDIWSFDAPPVAKDRHPCAKPLDLLEHIITASTRPGATVRDDFMGGGSTGVACIRTGRKFIGVEKDARYFEIARQRLENELRQWMLPLTYTATPCK